MDKATYTLTIDHDYGCGMPMDPRKFMAGVEMVRRLLDEQVPCKQIGACTFAFPSEKRSKVFSAIDRMSYNGILPALRFSFARTESLDHEFESWRERDHQATPWISTQDEETVDGQDFFEMSLEKG